MKIGTKSLLFGLHQFLLHPCFVLAGWMKLYGLPKWKELVCIMIHDWGYWGCGDIDGDEGGLHSEWAAGKVVYYFDKSGRALYLEYYYLCLLHSRFYAQRVRSKPSKLCWADKLGTALMPWWLWYGLGWLTGEYDEVTTCIKHREVLGEGLTTPKAYFMAYRAKVMEWINEECN